MGDVTHIRPAGNDPQGHLSGRELERHEREGRAALGRGWAVAPVPVDGQPHEQWPNRCTVCSDDSPGTRAERIATGEATREIQQLGALGGGAGDVGEFAERVRPGIAAILPQLRDVGGEEAIARGVAHLVAQWMSLALSERMRHLEATADLAQERVRYEDLEKTVIELDTAKTDLPLMLRDGEVLCPCGSDDLLWEYDGARTHQVLRFWGWRDGLPVIVARARYEVIDGDEKRGRVRCQVCGQLLAPPVNMVVDYEP